MSAHRAAGHADRRTTRHDVPSVPGRPRRGRDCEQLRRMLATCQPAERPSPAARRIDRAWPERSDDFAAGRPRCDRAVGAISRGPASGPEPRTDRRNTFDGGAHQRSLGSGAGRQRPHGAEPERCGGPERTRHRQWTDDRRPGRDATVARWQRSRRQPARSTCTDDAAARACSTCRPSAGRGSRGRKISDLGLARSKRPTALDARWPIALHPRGWNR